jgi:hypothetical protein
MRKPELRAQRIRCIAKTSTSLNIAKSAYLCCDIVKDFGVYFRSELSLKVQIARRSRWQLLLKSGRP